MLLTSSNDLILVRHGPTSVEVYKFDNVKDMLPTEAVHNGSQLVPVRQSPTSTRSIDLAPDPRISHFIDWRPIWDTVRTDRLFGSSRTLITAAARESVGDGNDLILLTQWLNVEALSCWIDNQDPTFEFEFSRRNIYFKQTNMRDVDTRHDLTIRIGTQGQHVIWRRNNLRQPDDAPPEPHVGTSVPIIALPSSSLIPPDNIIEFRDVYRSMKLLPGMELAKLADMAFCDETGTLVVVTIHQEKGQYHLDFFDY